MRAIRLLALLLLFALAAACGDSTSEPAIPSAAGAWSGTAGGFTVNLLLSAATDGSLSGTGSVAATTGPPLPFTVTGTHAHPNFSLVARAPAFEDINFQGQFTDANTIDGMLTGAGFNHALRLRRQ